jgi:hypothetical protein
MSRSLDTFSKLRNGFRFTTGTGKGTREKIGKDTRRSFGEGSQEQ